MRRFTYLIFTSALSLLSACEQVSDTGAKIEVSTNYLEYPCNGGTQEIDITMPCDWSASCEEEWITITPSSGEAGDAKLSVSVTANLSQEPRNATIIIGNSEYEISNEITLSQAKPVQHIFYTSADNQVVKPFNSDEFGANIISNTYENGMGLITFDAPVTSIGDEAFYKCTSLTSITIPDSVTDIEGYAFCDCTSLTSVTIPDSVTSIGSCAFYDCASLTSITIPDSVTKIGSHAFYHCASLTSVTIPDSVTDIEWYAFCNCISLTSVTIPDSVTSIGSCAFIFCTSLKEVYCKPTTPPTAVIEYDWKAFSSNASGRKIYVPTASVEAYKAAQYWSDYADYIEGKEF